MNHFSFSSFSIAGAKGLKFSLRFILVLIMSLIFESQGFAKIEEVWIKSSSGSKISMVSWIGPQLKLSLMYKFIKLKIKLMQKY